MKIKMMFLILSLLSGHSFASGIYFYTCIVERKANDGLKLKHESVLQLKQNQVNTNKFNINFRWTNVDFSLSPQGDAELVVKEGNYDEKVINQKKSWKIDGHSYLTPQRIGEELTFMKEGKKVSYQIRCK